MTILDLKDQIMKNNLKNFYIFTGEEIGIINIYLNQMSKVLGLPITRANSVLDILPSCSGGSLFGDSRHFYVIRDDKDFQKAENAYTTISDTVGKSVIVLLYDKIDSRLKFGKFFKDEVIAFEKLTPNVLKSYIKKEISLSDNNIDTLMDLCGGSYDMCMLEIDKIRQHCEYQFTQVLKQEITTEDKSFEELLACGVIYQPEETDVFKFTDAVCSKNFVQAFKLEETLRANNNSSIVLLGTLYNSMKTIMLIQCCSPGAKVSEVTGLDNRQLYFARKYVNTFRTDRLVEAVKLISSVIDDVKSGRIEDIYATRYVLSRI